MVSLKNEEMQFQRSFWRTYFKLNAISWHLNEKIPIYWDTWLDKKARFMMTTFMSAESRTPAVKQVHVISQLLVKKKKIFMLSYYSFCISVGLPEGQNQKCWLVCFFFHSILYISFYFLYIFKCVYFIL